MKRFWSLIALAACFSIAACGTPSQNVAKTHGADAIALRDHGLLMKYDSVAQAIEAEGRTLMQLSLIGQSNTPPPAAAPSPQAQPPRAPAQMPQNVKDAKLRWVPPPLAPPPPPCPPSPPPVLPQPKVLATAKEGGTTTKHDVAMGLAYSVPAAAGFVGGNAVAPGVNIGVNAVAKGGKMSQSQGQGQISNNTNNNNNNNSANSSSSSSSSSAAAAGN